MNKTIGVHALDIFALRDTVVDEYKRFATSFTTIKAPDIATQVRSIYDENRYWPEPLVQLNPSYKLTTDVGALAASGELDPECARIFRNDGEPLKLYQHQAEAVALAERGQSYVVTTGTGSGKSLCYFLPIVHRILSEKHKNRERRTRAIVIYPMNALANSQREELQRYLGNVSPNEPITFARYTGQESQEERRWIAANPPDILLTNFMMLELLMTRQEELDRKVVDNCVGLRFLVLDELHTYRGRQGADVALLVRRVRERLRPENLQCIGTSATMASVGSAEEKSVAVARVASRLFAEDIRPGSVIGETLERVTRGRPGAEIPHEELADAIRAGIAPGLRDEQLASHPLAVWVETTLGVTLGETDHRWVRARPRSLSDAVTALASQSGCTDVECRAALRDLLLLSSIPESERAPGPNTNKRSFFAFKLHQFISGAGNAYATLEPPGQRTVTVDGQVFLPGAPDKRLYALHFCRTCGHEFHPVRLIDDGEHKHVHARSIDDAPPILDSDDPAAGVGDDQEQFGFITMLPRNNPDFTFEGNDDDYPETWLDFDAAGGARLKSTYRKARLTQLHVSPDGKVGAGAPAWFLPGRFRFCPACGDLASSSARDRTRLASLSAEGRSSATTVLVASTLRWMHSDRSGLEQYTRKLLGFTDNRQDAALQAGHFNDFVYVSLLRAGFVAALQNAGPNGLRSDEIGLAQQRALGLDRNGQDVRAEWLLDPVLKGLHLQEAESTLRQVLAYRVWFDQRRGWRYTNPNLEGVELVEVDYLGLHELVHDQAEFDNAHPLLKHASPDVRVRLYRELLDHLRVGLAVRSQVLDQAFLEQLKSRSHSRLRASWGFGDDEFPRGARWLMITAPKKKDTRLRDADLIVRGGSRSALGRRLRTSALWDGATAIRDLKSKDFDVLVGNLLKAATVHGLLSEESTPFDLPGWRLNDAAVRFRTRVVEPGQKIPKANAFFRDLYLNLAALLGAQQHPLFGFEAREHTAQVEGERREVREKRFRYGEKEREELAAQESRLRELGEAGRFLPVLFCSPTMELGVDISTLNVVQMRNVPPTPANYAQRSGRAGRSGQAALVLTYASSQSPHDQYFFRDPPAMVHGEVKAPLLDLANRDLIDSHLQAVWLSCVDEPLDASIANLLLLPDRNRPLRDDLLAAIQQQRVSLTAKERIRRVLDLVASELTAEQAPWYPGREVYADAVVAAAPSQFAASFQRWRDLFAAAEEARDAARRTLDDYSAPPGEKRAAETRQAQAQQQLNLLQQGTNSLSSDFYTYRYLATEGFLPGYNFPRLPLMAYIPAGKDGRGRQTYLQRPRFLALSEFGPRSLVYHEGRAYRVTRALFSLGNRNPATPNVELPTQTVRICVQCGAGHFNDRDSVCHACNAPLGGAEIVRNVYRIDNVGTQPAERITANDEERQRQGFELQTTFEWAIRDNERDVRGATAADEDGAIAELAYGPGARITRLNKGLRRRANKTTLGFKIDPISGAWAKNEDDDDSDDPTASPRQWIVPSVGDHKNALLFKPSRALLNDQSIATLQHALLRGIEAVFQLEEGELLAEPVPTRDVRKGCLLYEATEGGAGVLVRLVAEPESLAAVARRALQIMHFDVSERGPLPASAEALQHASSSACVAACYRCLMSYYNQPDHEKIDRRDVDALDVLLRLAGGTVVSLPGERTTPAEMPITELPTNEPSWLAQAYRRGIPPADTEPLIVGDVRLSYVWRKHYVVASDEGVSNAALIALEDLGFEVVRVDASPESVERLVASLGRLG